MTKNKRDQRRTRLLKVYFNFEPVNSFAFSIVFTNLCACVLTRHNQSACQLRKSDKHKNVQSQLPHLLGYKKTGYPSRVESRASKPTEEKEIEI